MSEPAQRHLFEVYGVELEYMIVDADTLSVRPITDQVLQSVAGEIVSDIERGSVTWSNELTLHVIELKTTEPAASFAPLPDWFHEQVNHINQTLTKFTARLMPTAMHPWMNPDKEMQLWPHDNSPVYEAFNRIFDCRGHGWANLQSVHLNLPFANDDEFGKLHAAIRLLLPLLPALSASSPVMDGRVSGLADNRLEVYRTNSRRIPSVAGRVIPEPVYTQTDYERHILGRIYADVAPLDPEGVLQHEWLNARGAIARFERNTIEIRVLDVQECPRADVAICAAAVGVLKELVAERWQTLARQQEVSVDALEQVLLSTIREAEQAVIKDTAYLRQFGFDAAPECTAAELWRHLVQAPAVQRELSAAGLESVMETILEYGPLARRISHALSSTPSHETLANVYRQLCNSLSSGRMFLPPM